MTTNIEIQILKHILKELITELEILGKTVGPNKPFTFNYDCPGLRMTLHDESIWKVQIFLKKVIKILELTHNEIGQQEPFIILNKEIEALNTDLNDYKEASTKANLLDNKLHKLKMDVTRVNSDLQYSRNNIANTIFEEDLKKETETSERRSKNQMIYNHRLQNANIESKLHEVERNSTEIKQEIMNWSANTDIEVRCSKEMQSFLTYFRAELADELNECMATQNRWTTESDEAAMALRMQTQQFSEEADRITDLFNNRKKEMEDFKELKRKVKISDEAMLTIQTWWRAQMVNEIDKLLKGSTGKKKKKVKKK